MASKKLILNGNSLSINKIEFFLHDNPSIVISKESKKKINDSRALVEKWIENGEIIYGVTTGFGEFANVNISRDNLRKLQENLILSHAVGCGEYLPPKIVKIMMLLRLNALVKGYSGIRISTLELLISMINNNIIPVVPSQGSVGSSGDLVQLAHLVLAMIGKGNVQLIKDISDDKTAVIKIIASSKGLKKYNLKPCGILKQKKDWH